MVVSPQVNVPAGEVAGAVASAPAPMASSVRVPAGEVASPQVMVVSPQVNVPAGEVAGAVASAPAPMASSVRVPAGEVASPQATPQSTIDESPVLVAAVEPEEEEPFNLLDDDDDNDGHSSKHGNSGKDDKDDKDDNGDGRAYRSAPLESSDRELLRSQLEQYNLLGVHDLLEREGIKTRGQLVQALSTKDGGQRLRDAGMRPADSYKLINRFTPT